MIAVDFSHLDTGWFGSRPWAVHTSSPRSLRDRRSRSPGPCCGTWPHSHTGLDHKHLRATSWRPEGRETLYLHYKHYIQIKLKNKQIKVLILKVDEMAVGLSWCYRTLVCKHLSVDYFDLMACNFIVWISFTLVLSTGVTSSSGQPLHKHLAIPHDGV